METRHRPKAPLVQSSGRMRLRAGIRSIWVWAGFVAGWAFILVLFGAVFISNRGSSNSPDTHAGGVDATAPSETARSPVGAAATESRTLVPNASPAAASATLPSAGPTPLATGRVLAVMHPLISVCVMPPGRQQCDAATQKRWDGDLAAWQVEAAERGAPLPDEAGAYREAVNLRIGMSDPITRINLAKAFGIPAIFMTGVWYLESPVGRRVEHIQVEIANLGNAYADLNGVRLVDDRNNVLLTLPVGSSLNAGRHCRLSTGPPAENACPFIPAVAAWPGEEELSALTMRAADGLTLDTFVPR